MAAQALQFLSLTAARSGEVRGMVWDELDFGPNEGSKTLSLATTATWTIPAARMKTGREHRVPLTPQALAILRPTPNEG
jgi:integrase